MTVWQGDHLEAFSRGPLCFTHRATDRKSKPLADERKPPAADSNAADGNQRSGSSDMDELRQSDTASVSETHAQGVMTQDQQDALKADVHTIMAEAQKKAAELIAEAQKDCQTKIDNHGLTAKNSAVQAPKELDGKISAAAKNQAAETPEVLNQKPSAAAATAKNSATKTPKESQKTSRSAKAPSEVDTPQTSNVVDGEKKRAGGIDRTRNKGKRQVMKPCAHVAMWPYCDDWYSRGFLSSALSRSICSGGISRSPTPSLFRMRQRMWRWMGPRLGASVTMF